MLPGLILLAALALAVLAALASLVLLAPGGGSGLPDPAYLSAIAGFTALQASLSALISLALGAAIALALARRAFWGRRLFLGLLGVATSLPAIVAIFAIAAIFGRSGFVNTALAGIGLPRFSIYGLPGILIAHVFFNAAFATRVYLAAIEAIPGEHWRLAASLGMPPFALFRLVDLPVLRRETPGLALLVFIACATSFAIPLTLGGGPASATFEVAIYQAIHFDVDFGRAAGLALLQIAAMATLVTLAAPLLNRPLETAVAGRRVERPDRDGLPLRLFDAVVLALALGLFLPPLLSLAAGVPALAAVPARETLSATLLSLVIAAAAAGLALFCAYTLSQSRIALAQAGHRRASRALALAPLLILAVPPLAFAAGLYVLARRLGDPAAIGVPVLILINAMMALPFVHRLVEAPLSVAASRYGRLAASLGMGALARLRLVEAPLLAGPAGAAFAFAMALSLGDLGVVALFGSSSLVTLPALLYARLGAYRMEEAQGIAALLAGLVLLLFLAAERAGRRHADPL